jgi:hypothetical protein
METIIHDVSNLDATGRSAAEMLVGHSLAENQQLLIQNKDVAASPMLNTTADTDQLPEWCNVYAGLSDEQIATLELAISRRLDLKCELGSPS